MQLIMSDHTLSRLKYRATNGAESLGEADIYEDTLEDLVLWLRRIESWDLIDDGDLIVLSIRNFIGIETERLGITCDVSDREELLATLNAVKVQTTAV